MILIHLVLNSVRWAVGVMNWTLPMYSMSPVCVHDSKNNLSVLVFKHAHRKLQLELVFRTKMFCWWMECFSEEAFQVFVLRSLNMNSMNKRRWLSLMKWLCLTTSHFFSIFPVSPSCLFLFILLSPSRFFLSIHLRYAVLTTRPTHSCRSSSSGCGTRWLTWRAAYCPRPCCSTGAGWAQRTFWYPSFKSRSSLFVRLPVWPSTGGTNPVSNPCWCEFCVVNNNLQGLTSCADC